MSRAAVAVVVGLLILTGCTPGPGPGPSTSTAGAPSKVFSDQELMAIGYATLWERGQSPNLIDDSSVTRTTYDTKPTPPAQYAAQPAECGVFHAPTADEALRDLSLNFASGRVPIADESSPTTTIRLTIRSADRDKLASADFDYTDDLASRCGEFGVVHVGQDPALHATVMLNPPAVGEKAYALMSPSDASTGSFGGVALRVLAGTVSISMLLPVSPVTNQAEAQPALNAMAAIAQGILHQAAQHPPAVIPPPANARTPQQLTDLLQEITGTDGQTVAFASGTVISGTSVGPMTPCTYSEGTYYSALIGSTVVHGEFPPSLGTSGSAGIISEISVRLVSMPSAATPPYPFDKRAADIRDCATIQEQVFTDSSSSMSQWTEIHRYSLNVAADSVYAISHEHPDTGGWHLLAGARRGSLSVEMATMWAPGIDPQPRFDQMAAVINQIFAKAAA